MATQLFLIGNAAAIHRGDNSVIQSGANSGWTPRALSTARGSGVTSVTTDTQAGTNPGVEVGLSTTGAYEWISEAVSADVTISGTITANIWASENSMNANVAINVAIDIIRATNNSIERIVRSIRTTELGTSSAVNNFTTGMGSGEYAGLTLNRGDRLRIVVFGDDAGTMASGFTFAVAFGGTTAAANGDTYVTFTEDFSFESTSPAGSIIYLTDTASAVATASVDREAWTSRGAGVQTDVTTATGGFAAPRQITDTAGGTVVDWFTKQLAATTLSGLAKGNIRASESSTSTAASIRVEIARVDANGTNATVWGSWCQQPSTGDFGELGTSETAVTVEITGDDLAISDGQRLRIRIYGDDLANAPMLAVGNYTVYYAGTSGGASGDTFVTFPITLTEYTPPASATLIRPRRPAHRFLTRR